ncbi:MAG: serine hydrolase domain-containing protein [Myxococcota bacterium]
MIRWGLLTAGLMASGCVLEEDASGEPPLCVEGSPRLPPSTGHPQADAFQQALESAVDAGLPGVSMAIRDRDGVWEGAAGFADLDRGTPMEPCHRTRIASVTKTFVAATVLRLVDQGRLGLDDTLGERLPQRSQRVAHADQITVRQLLSHTSGVYNFLDVPLVLELFNRPDRTWTVQECFEQAADRDSDFAPGTGWSYSNTNYILLGWIIEAVTGLPHEQVMHDEFFEPLELYQTSYRVDDFDVSGVVHGYFDLFGDQALVDSTDSYANLCIGPDGGMISSAHDMLVFFDHLFGEEDLLSSEALSQMLPFAPTGEPDFPTYGLGIETWGEGERLAYGHGGHEFGYRTFAYHFPAQDLTFVVWFNASSLLPGDDNIAATINAQRDHLRDLALGLAE